MASSRPASNPGVDATATSSMSEVAMHAEAPNPGMPDAEAEITTAGAAATAACSAAEAAAPQLRPVLDATDAGAALDAIQQLCELPASPDPRRAKAERAWITMLIRMLEQFARNDAVSERCVTTLGLVANCSANVSQIMSEGGVSALERVLDLHAAQPRVRRAIGQTFSCMARFSIHVFAEIMPTGVDPGASGHPPLALMKALLQFHGAERAAADVERNASKFMASLIRDMADSELVGQRCLALACQCLLHQRICVSAVAAGGVAPLVEALQRHPRHELVRRYACMALDYIAQTVPECHASIVGCGGATALANVLMQPDPPAGLIVQAMNVCFLLTSSEEITSQTANALSPAMPHLLACVSRDASDANVTQVAAGAMGMMARFGDPSALLVVARSIPMFTASLRRHARNASVVLGICKTFVDVANRSRDMQAALIAADAIALLHAAIDTHPQDSAIALQACGILSMLATFSGETMRSIAEKGGVRRICGSMARHVGDARAAWVATGLLLQMSHDAETAVRVRAEGGIAQVLNVMKHHLDHDDVVRNAVNCLWTLVSRAMDASVYLAVASGLPILVAALQKQRVDMTIANIICGIFMQMTIHDREHPQVLATADGALALVDCLRHYPQDARFVRLVALNLSKVAEVPKGAMQIAEKGGVQLLSAALHRHASDADVVEMSARVLHRLMYAGPNPAPMLAAGALVGFVRGLEHHARIESAVAWVSSVLLGNFTCSFPVHPAVQCLFVPNNDLGPRGIAALQQAVAHHGLRAPAGTLAARALIAFACIRAWTV